MVCSWVFSNIRLYSHSVFFCFGLFNWNGNRLCAMFIHWNVCEKLSIVSSFHVQHVTQIYCIVYLNRDQIHLRRLFHRMAHLKQQQKITSERSVEVFSLFQYAKIELYMLFRMSDELRSAREIERNIATEINHFFRWSTFTLRAAAATTTKTKYAEICICRRLPYKHTRIFSVFQYENFCMFQSTTRQDWLQLQIFQWPFSLFFFSLCFVHLNEISSTAFFLAPEFVQDGNKLCSLSVSKHKPNGLPFLCLFSSQFGIAFKTCFF